MSLQSMAEKYVGARAVLATMHGKEVAVSDPFRSYLQLQVIVPEFMDTDRFGSLTSEVKRSGSLIETARRKALEGMETTGLGIGMASEGEYLPGPNGYNGHEVLLFLDRDRKVELIEEEPSVPSNFRQWVVGSFAEIAPDLGAVGLPEYRLTVRPSQGDLTDLVFKGIGHRRVLEMAIEMATSYSTDACAVVEVDMRAHQNPARMKIISQLAERLAQRVAALT